MKPLTRAIVEQDRMTNRIPDCRELHASRPAHREMKAARLAAFFQKAFVEPERTEQKVLSFANHLLDVMPKLIEGCQFQNAIRLGRRIRHCI